jgi:hypothetical protein
MERGLKERDNGGNVNMYNISLSELSLLIPPYNEYILIKIYNNLKTEISPCIISDRNGIKLDLNYKRNYRKYSNTWRLNNTWLNVGHGRNKGRNQKFPRI